MGGKGGKTQAVNNAPWAATQPYWNQAFEGIFGTQGTPETQRFVPNAGGFGHYETVAATPGTPGILQNQLNNPNQYITQGWDNTAAQANDPNNSALLTGSRDYANRVLGGEFLDPTKNLNYAMNLRRGLEDMGAFDSQAESAGRYGSGAWGQMKGRTLADLQGNLYGQGLNQMTQMSALAPQIYQSQFLPAQTLSNLGQQQESRPWDLYGRAAQLLQGPGGGQQTTNVPGANPMTGALGGAATGAYIGSVVPGIGTGIGALAGGALGYLGSR